MTPCAVARFDTDGVCFFFKEKEKLMGEIQKRAQLLKKQQEAQASLKAKIKVN